MFIIGQSQHVAGPAIITVVLQAACCETDPGTQPARCHLAPNKVFHVLPWDFWETGLRSYFQGDFLFLRLILAVWAQYQMLGKYVFNMIWIPLGQETCNVCICHGRAQLGFAHQFVKPSRKEQFMLTQRDSGAYPWAQGALASLPSPPHAWCVSRWCRTAFVNSASSPDLNFHLPRRQGDRWLGWRINRAGTKLCLAWEPGITGWAAPLGRRQLPLPVPAGCH